jgi:excinuclease ABC subunit A
LAVSPKLKLSPLPVQAETSTGAPPAPDALRVRGARTHNLRNISLDIPHNRLTVVTGVSGSGKSSLAFDTIYAEGQRQYIESLSTYARQFLGQLERPDVDSVEGLQPTLCIDQRMGTVNPRSTVATVTEVYDYLRLLMARVGTPHCYACGCPILQQSTDAILNVLDGLPEGTRLVMLAPIVRGRKGAHKDVFEKIRKAGLVRVRVDNELHDVESAPDLAVRKNHTIEAVVDKVVLRPGNQQRLADSLRVALKLADGLASVSYLTPVAEQEESNRWQEQLFSTRYACPDCGVNYEEVEPRTFSFNSPYGACSCCGGVGTEESIDERAILSDWSLAPADGAFAVHAQAPSGTPKRRVKRLLESALAELGSTWKTPLAKLKTAARQRLLTGAKDAPGILAQLQSLRHEDPTQFDWLSSFARRKDCSGCGGSRLRREALAVRLGGKNIHEICSMNIEALVGWFQGLELTDYQTRIAGPILQEMLHRLRFLHQVGVGYLTLARGADSLSGGELQRVRLASCIGSGLVGVCYILDEPSIGLHQRDNDRLIQSLRHLADQGNTVLVVEHDEAIMLAADCLIDMGPGAGQYGGEIIAAGTPSDIKQHPTSLTAQYLTGSRRTAPERSPRPVDPARQLRLRGASLHNLRTIDVDFPLGLLIGITGVSGSGKSSLINRTLVPALAGTLAQRGSQPGPYAALEGTEHVDKLIEITQAPIGRTPRSTPATYCGVFDLMREVWANTREAKARGYTASRFSFNAGTGRCPACNGQGQEKIEMNFLPDLFVTCTACHGARFNRQTLQVRYRNCSIADVLQMSVDEATEFFGNFEKIHRLLSSLQKVGLGYLSLGQNSTTLSGGEAQRIKLAAELARPDTGKTIYFIDEPTTGLHFDDIARLIRVLDSLVERGNTVIVIEHNLDVIRSCDWLIDLGPDGGQGGGALVACGSPADVAKNNQSVTGKYLC